MKIFLIVAAVIIAAFIISQIYFIMAKTETQSYSVIKTENDYEIRLYPPATMATVSLDAKSYKELSTTGFKKLASYIFGGNQEYKSIAMTSPVRMDISDSISDMSFVMPSEYSIETLPKPNDSTIKIKTSDEEYIAAISFGGFVNDEEIKKNASKLENILQKKGIHYFGNFRFLGYNAPYQLFDRKNEIIVDIKWSSANSEK